MDASPQRPMWGWRRQRQTRRSVRVIDILARNLIAVGGIGTILAISTVGAFLIWVVAPLFRGASVGGQSTLASAPGAQTPLHVAMDEHQIVGLAVVADGTARAFDLHDGRQLASIPLSAGDTLTAATFPTAGNEAYLGFADGTLRCATFGFATVFPTAAGLPAGLSRPRPGERVPYDGGILELADSGELRHHQARIELDEPLEAAVAGPVALVDGSTRANARVIAALGRDGTLRVFQQRARRNLLTGRTEWTTQRGESRLAAPAGHGLPTKLAVNGQGDSVYLAWPDGVVQRMDTSDPQSIRLAETADLVPEPGARLTALEFALGKSTLVVGDSRGRVRAWMPLQREGDAAAKLVAVHDLGETGAAVCALAASSRTRLLSVAFADGRVELVHLTSERHLARLQLPAGQVAVALAVAPKEDGLLAWGEGGRWRWSIDPRHPEAGLAALFLPVWYEGYPAPAHVWQSSSGTDDFEPKLGLWPLVFGTLKATFYSMLLGVPIALLAAVFTSEFLRPGARARVKPAVELMASLPSVVLGFLAALVIAPFVRTVLPAILAALVTLPLAVLGGAYAWQLLPARTTLRLSPWRLAVIALTLPLGVLLAWLLGPVVERWCFAGDILLWLDGQAGGAMGGWLFLTLPTAALCVVMLGDRLLEPWLRRVGAAWDRQRWATVEASRFLLSGFGALALAVLLALVLTAVGLDPRGWFLGTYEQSNALIVGFVMGFAIIPIIYTIAEDALTAVPEHLRSASLGAGATPWQTARRVVIPTAMSGLFSAVMVGLGRAVGETMIVLMAAGNTPLMDWNIFNGFRTLSANIAVELPEAVRDSTHYRTLFLAALTLFGLTFILNTFAEIVRQRYRRRAFEL